MKHSITGVPSSITYHDAPHPLSKPPKRLKRELTSPSQLTNILTTCYHHSSASPFGPPKLLNLAIIKPKTNPKWTYESTYLVQLLRQEGFSEAEAVASIQEIFQHSAMPEILQIKERESLTLNLMLTKLVGQFTKKYTPLQRKNFIAIFVGYLRAEIAAPEEALAIYKKSAALLEMFILRCSNLYDFGGVSRDLYQRCQEPLKQATKFIAWPEFLRILDRLWNFMAVDRLVYTTYCQQHTPAIYSQLLLAYEQYWYQAMLAFCELLLYDFAVFAILSQQLPGKTPATAEIINFLRDRYHYDFCKSLPSPLAHDLIKILQKCPTESEA